MPDDSRLDLLPAAPPAPQALRERVRQHPIAAPRSPPFRLSLFEDHFDARCSVGLRIRAETSVADPSAPLTGEIHTSERRLQWFRNSRGDRDAANLAERVRDGHASVRDVCNHTLGGVTE